MLDMPTRRREEHHGVVLDTSNESTSAEISVVIPVYRAERALSDLVARLERALTALERSFEVIFVDDRSPDDSWRVLKELKDGASSGDISKPRPWMRLIRLLKNSGQHNALLCGLSFARGSVVLTMDDDLQHPPEEIPKLIASVDDGVDLVVGSFEPLGRKGIGILGGAFVDRTLRRIFKLPSDFQLTSFRAMRGVVARQVAEMRGAYPYLTAMILSHTATYQNVPVAHAERMHGRSNYSPSNSIRLSFNLLINYSSYPLYVMAALCVASLIVFTGLGIWVVARTLGNPATVPGWASTLVVLAFSNSIITSSLLIQFLYVARMSHQLARSRISYAIGEVQE